MDKLYLKLNISEISTMGINIAFIKSLHKASPVAFGAVDMLNEEIIYSSGHAEELLGYTKSELTKLSKNSFEA